MRYLVNIADVSSFGNTSRVSENMGGDIRLPAEDRWSHCGRRFPGKDC